MAIYIKIVVFSLLCVELIENEVKQKVSGDWKEMRKLSGIEFVV